MKKNLVHVVLTGIVLCVFIGCIPRPLKQDVQEQDRTDSSEIEYMGKTRGEYCFELLQKMKETYVNQQLQAFMEFVHRDFRKDKATLRARVRNDMKNLDFVRYDMYKDRTTTAERQGDVDVILEFHFVAQYINRSTGEQTTVEGNSTAIWRTGQDDYRLWNVRGDTFFGFSDPGAGNRPDLRTEITEVNTDLIRIDVSNTGGDTAKEIRVRMRLNPDGGGGRTETRTISSLAPGATRTLSFSPGPSGGSGQVRSEADPEQRIIEENETNNSDRTSYSLGP